MIEYLMLLWFRIVMKGFIYVCLLCSFWVSVTAQDRYYVMLSNITQGQVLINGIPADKGEARVQLVRLDGSFVGGQIPILGAGYFSGNSGYIDTFFDGEQMMVAVFVGENNLPSAYSKPFRVSYPPNVHFSDTIGGSMWDFMGVNVTSTEPAWTDYSVVISKQSRSKLYRGLGLHLVRRENEELVLRFVGKLESAPCVEGPWLTVTME